MKHFLSERSAEMRYLERCDSGSESDFLFALALKASMFENPAHSTFACINYSCPSSRRSAVKSEPRKSKAELRFT